VCSDGGAFNCISRAHYELKSIIQMIVLGHKDVCVVTVERLIALAGHIVSLNVSFK